MKVDDLTSGRRGRSRRAAQPAARRARFGTRTLVRFRPSRAGDAAPFRKEVGRPTGLGKALNVDEHGPGGNSTSTRCRFCGHEERDPTTPAPAGRKHIQVVVACGSCGHQFAALSSN